MFIFTKQKKPMENDSLRDAYGVLSKYLTCVLFECSHLLIEHIFLEWISVRNRIGSLFVLCSSLFNVKSYLPGTLF